jgi:hypothetical protein
MADDNVHLRPTTSSVENPLYEEIYEASKPLNHGPTVG